MPNNRLLQAGAIAAVALLAGAVFYASWKSAQKPRGKPDPEPVVELDPGKQKQIWDNEHITFELEKRFGTAFLQALRAKDPSRVRNFLRPGFRGEVLVGDPEAVERKGLLSESRRGEASASPQVVDARGLAEALLAYLAPFRKVERQTLRVLRIEQISHEPPRWKAKLLLGFTGSDARGEALECHSEHRVECSIPDEMKIDRVASLDSWRVEKETWRRCRQPLTEEVTAAAGLADLPIPDNWDLPAPRTKQYHFQTAVADYNRDGFLDIAVAILGRKPLLLESQGGKAFRDVAPDRGLTATNRRACFVAAWIDYDNDSWPDLVLGDRLYHNLRGERFEDVTARSGLHFDPECMGAITADYDGDGRLDLYLIYQKGPKNPRSPKKETWVDESGSGLENHLWRNEGGGAFRDVTARSRAGGGKRHTFAAAWFFHDGDRWPDLYLANDFGKNVVLRNRGDGTFEDVSARSGAEDFATSMGVATGDVDNDGRPDLYVANMYSKMGRRIIGQVSASDYPPGIYEQIKGSCAGNRLYLNRDGSGYRDFSEPMGVYDVGWAFGPALFDLDGDGWLDAYACTGFMSFSPRAPDG